MVPHSKVIPAPGECTREGRESVEDDACSGRSQTSRTTEKIEKVSMEVTKCFKQRPGQIENTTVVSHTSYSLNFTTCDFRIFLELSRGFQGRRFQFAAEIKSASLTELNDTAKNRFQKCFNDHYKQWEKCVVAQRSYFKGGCVSE
ncbi:hypothetical protein TNCV_298041 [Trichonephila clavipes]|nr:hypothetical protein TNCV_298041 [Trichonephila clavipes]